MFLSWLVFNLLACIRILFPHPLHHFSVCCTRIIPNQNQHSDLCTCDGATAQVARPSAGKFPRLVVLAPLGPRPPCPESLIMADPSGTAGHCMFVPPASHRPHLCGCALRSATVQLSSPVALIVLQVIKVSKHEPLKNVDIVAHPKRYRPVAVCLIHLTWLCGVAHVLIILVLNNVEGGVGIASASPSSPLFLPCPDHPRPRPAPPPTIA